MDAYKDISGLTFLTNAGVVITQINTIEHV
jgi:hypothetical protein